MSPYILQYYLINLKTGDRCLLSRSGTFDCKFPEKYRRILTSIDDGDGTPIPVKIIQIGDFSLMENPDENHLYQNDIAYEFDNKLFSMYYAENFAVYDLDTNTPIPIDPLTLDDNDYKSSYHPLNYGYVMDCSRGQLSSISFNKFGNNYAIILNSNRILFIDMDNKKFLFLPDYFSILTEYYKDNLYYIVTPTSQPLPGQFLDDGGIHTKVNINIAKLNSNNTFSTLETHQVSVGDFSQMELITQLLNVEQKRFMFVLLEGSVPHYDLRNVYKDIRIIIYSLDTFNKIDDFTLDLTGDEFVAEMREPVGGLAAALVNNNTMVVSFISHKYNAAEIVSLDIEKKKILNKYFVPLDWDVSNRDPIYQHLAVIKGRIFLAIERGFLF